MIVSCWQDWPENVSGPAVTSRAVESERRQFELEISQVCQTVTSLLEARQDTIDKLRASAAYLDSVWLRCRVSRTMGSSASVVGGGLTIAGGVLTTLTAGAAAPVLIAGLATSSLGAATNIGASLVEKIVNSKQIREMNAAFSRDKEITLKLESQLEEMKQYKRSENLDCLLEHVQTVLGPEHLLVAILRGSLANNLNTRDSLAAGLSSQEENTVMVEGKSQEEQEEQVNYNPLDAGVLVEGGKVIGQNSIRVAGQVVIGISAAFLVWDVIDLGFTITDLVKKQGSKAARTLKQKAEMLDLALRETTGVYCIEMPL